MPCDPYIIDASSIIQIKLFVPGRGQWEVFKGLEVLVEESRLGFPREVAREVRNVAHPDAPGVWVYGVEVKLQHPIDPDETVLRDVLAEVPNFVDPELGLNGDPYVVALAEQLRRAGHGTRVVTEDVTDLPNLISVASACDHMGIPRLSLATFLADEGLYPSA